MGRPIQFSFTDRATGAPVATAIVPEGYLVNATITEQYANDIVPLHAYVAALDRDQSIMLNSNSKSMWGQLINPLLVRTAKMMGTRQSNFGDYVDPDRYLREFAAAYTDDKQATPVARAVLPGSFADNRQTLLDNMVSEFIAREGTGPNVELEIINAVCDPVLMKFTGIRKGKPMVCMVGYEFMGIEYRNAITPAMLMGGGIGLLAGLIGSARKAKASGASAPFGHAKEHGQSVDAIRWGFNRLYSCVCDAEKEDQATEEFMRFVLSFTPDMSFIQRREQMAFEIWQQAMQVSNQLAAQARQAQIQAQQRAMEASRLIARNSAEMSAGIMDSWNRKMASDSRISQARSEAIRGVNTYQTTGGQPVEVGVTADHVYQNGFGDVYGVSGAAPDQEILNRLNWTEIHRR